MKTQRYTAILGLPIPTPPDSELGAFFSTALMRWRDDLTAEGWQATAEPTMRIVHDPVTGHASIRVDGPTNRPVSTD